MKQISKSFDYIVIGAGSGGLLVAVGLLRLGKDVAVVSENIGGDCTHYGCVPSKTLLHLAKKCISENDSKVKSALKLDALKKVREVVSSFVDEENEILPKDRYFKGSATFISKDSVSIKTDTGEQELKCNKKCIIATGSSPLRLSVPGIPPAKILSNEEIFYLEKMPTSITIFGGGPIGAEMATAFASFGVTTYLLSRTYLPKEPEIIAKKSLKRLQSLGVRYIPARPVKLENNKLYVDEGEPIPETDVYLSAVGRIPNTKLGLDRAGIIFDKAGIQVDANLTTSNRNVFAIGDCTQNPQFTHLAANHGKFVVKKIMVPFAKRRLRALPRVTFTNPPIASVGSTDKSGGSHQFELNFSQLDRARTNFESDSRGIVSVDTKTGHILGASLLGDFSEELINLFTLMMDEQIPLLRMTDFITPYPTYGNIMHNLSRDYMIYLSKNWKKYPLGSMYQFISYLFT